MIFGRKSTPQQKRLELGLDSDLSLNLIDVIHLSLHPAFQRPEGRFFIQGIGTVENAEGSRDLFNVYAKNGPHRYWLALEARGEVIESASFYQNVLTLTPDGDEWPGLLQSITAQTLDLDGIAYQRVWGGEAEYAELCVLDECVTTREARFECQNRLMSFQRAIQPGDFIERLKVVVEVIDSQQQASVSFYVGFDIHPSTITILGH